MKGKYYRLKESINKSHHKDILVYQCVLCTTHLPFVLMIFQPGEREVSKIMEMTRFGNILK